MKFKELPKDIKAAVYMRVGRAEQLLDAVTEFIEKENKMSDKITFKFTDEQVRVLREALLSYNNPVKNKISNDLFEHLGNKLRDFAMQQIYDIAYEKYLTDEAQDTDDEMFKKYIEGKDPNVNRSTEES